MVLNELEKECDVVAKYLNAQATHDIESLEE